MAKAEMTLTRQEIFDATFEYIRKYYGVKGQINVNIRTDHLGGIVDAKVKYDVPTVKSDVKRPNPFKPRTLG